MARRVALALALVAAVALLPAFAGVAGAGDATTTVKLKDDFFKPRNKSIAKNTKVRFKWVGSNRHNVTKKRGPGGNFASETTAQRGVNFKKRFRKKGTYKLICTVHADTMRMKLEVG